MTGKEYADIIDGFDVENNSKYLPSGGYTYCNISMMPMGSLPA